jgi:hypothetical protein
VFERSVHARNNAAVDLHSPLGAFFSPSKLLIYCGGMNPYCDFLQRVLVATEPVFPLLECLRIVFGKRGLNLPQVPTRWEAAIDAFEASRLLPRFLPAELAHQLARKLQAKRLGTVSVL